MKHIVTMGELLVDFISHEKGVNLSKVKNFKKMVGGAAANVAASLTWFIKISGVTVDSVHFKPINVTPSNFELIKEAVTHAIENPFEVTS